MDVAVTRDGARFSGTWELDGGWLIVTSPLGSRVVVAEPTEGANRKRATELLADIVDDALSTGPRGR